MLNLPVHWSEGMFLRPQHFQAADRFWTELSGTSQRIDSPYAYGLYSVRLSQEALGNGQVELSEAVFRMRDGTVWSMEAGQGPDRLPLAAAFDKQSSVEVYLAVPRVVLGRRNVSPESTAEPVRYVTVEQTQQDESAGGDPQPLELLRPQFRLLLETDDLAGFEVLPIARVVRAGDARGVAALDENYIPPLLATSAWAELDRGLLRPLYDRMGQKMAVLAEQVRSRGLGLSSQEPGDLDRVLMLHALNEAQARYSTLVFAQGVHPFQMYAELTRIMGMLTIFLDERVNGEIKPYQHDDLGTIFRWVRDEIVRRLDALSEYVYETRFFTGAGKGMQVALDHKWLHRDWLWYVGVYTSDITPEMTITMMTSQKFAWKLASAAEVDRRFSIAAEGLEFKPLSQVPPPLPTRSGWVYFSVQKEGPAWQAVMSEQSLAMRFVVSAIANLNKLDSSRHVEFNLGQKTAKVEFCLFAVPKPGG